VRFDLPLVEFFPGLSAFDEDHQRRNRGDNDACSMEDQHLGHFAVHLALPDDVNKSNWEHKTISDRAPSRKTIPKPFPLVT
jgi:hypothetical protein